MLLLVSPICSSGVTQKKGKLFLITLVEEEDTQERVLIADELKDPC